MTYTKEQWRKYTKQWVKKNPEKRALTVKKNNEKSTERKKKWHYMKYFENLIEKKECLTCGKKTGLVVHHVDGSSVRRDGYANNDAENLIVLCRACHLNVHRDEYKVKKI